MKFTLDDLGMVRYVGDTYGVRYMPKGGRYKLEKSINDLSGYYALYFDTVTSAYVKKISEKTNAPH
jgi:hypothetical protein